MYTWIYSRHRTIWIVCPLSPKLVHIPEGAVGIAILGSPHHAVLGTSCLGVLSLSWGSRITQAAGRREGDRDFHRRRETYVPSHPFSALRPVRWPATHVLCWPQWCLKLSLEKCRPRCWEPEKSCVRPALHWPFHVGIVHKCSGPWRKLAPGEIPSLHVLRDQASFNSVPQTGHQCRIGVEVGIWIYHLQASHTGRSFSNQALSGTTSGAQRLGVLFQICTCCFLTCHYSIWSLTFLSNLQITVE